MKTKRFSPWDTSHSCDNNLWEVFLNNKVSKICKFNKNYESDLQCFTTTIEKVYRTIKEYNFLNLLVFGFIQSGKTDFIIGTISKVFSKKNINIVFSINQNNTDLLLQTINRTKDIIKSNVYDFNEARKNKYQIIEEIKKGNGVALFLLKNKEHLKFANELVFEIGNKNINYKSLIIDDEGDSMSHDNINKEKSTTIFKLIKDLKTQSNSNFISITATPFVHFLLKDTDYLKPNKCFSLKPSTGYTGISSFINNLVENDKSIFTEIQSINKDDIIELTINDDFIKAIKYFVVQCYWWRYVIKFDNFPRMLINISKLNIKHYEIEERLKSILTKFNQQRNNNFFDDILKDLDLYEYKNNFIENLSHILKNTESYICNNSNKEKINLDEPSNDKYLIVIGQNKLNRGLTIIDLINTFITSRSSLHPNADSILQQARFLGYREKYFEKMKVFLTKELINDYKEIDKNLNYFMNIINNECSFEKIKNYVPLSNEYNLYPTRSSVANYDYYDTSKKIDIINNKFYKNDKNELDIKNENFYNKTVSHNSKSKDSSNNELIKFNNLVEFAKFYGCGHTKSALKNYLNSLCSFDENDEWIINDIIEKCKDYQIIVRILKENKRILTSNKTNNYLTIGKGNYCRESTEYEFYLINKTISIDVIPINVYSKDNKINKQIYRTRIFIPMSLRSINGFYS